MKTPEELALDIIQLMLDNPRDPNWIAKKLPALLAAWRDEAVEEAERHAIKATERRLLYKMPTIESARQSPAPEGGEVEALLKDIAEFGSPEGRRGEAIAHVVYWGNKARALLARAPRASCEHELVQFDDDPTKCECVKCEVIFTLLPSAPRADGWISVKERLPEQHKSVVVAYGGDVWIGALYGSHWYDSVEGDQATPTHWMPLPEPPKEGVK